MKWFVDYGVPLELSRVFCICFVRSEQEITEEQLVTGLLNYLCEGDAVMVTFMLNGEDVDNDDWLDFLSRMKCHTVPKNTYISKVNCVL